MQAGPDAVSDAGPTCLTLGIHTNIDQVFMCAVHGTSAPSPITVCEAAWQRLHRVAELRKNYLDQLPLCPDHRDKVRGKSCRQCAIETLAHDVLRMVTEIESHTPNVHITKRWVQNAKERAIALVPALDPTIQPSGERS